MNARCGGLFLLAAALATACSVNLDKATAGDFVQNRCTADSECGKGTCHSGVCVAYEGALSSLLIEVAPPYAAVGVGGVRFLQVKSDLARSSDDTKIELSPTTDVHGFLSALKGCGDSVSVPIRITLTPREETYGLEAVRYTAETRLIGLQTGDSCYGQVKKAGNDQATIQTEQFVVSVPVGTNSPVKCSNGTDNNACYDVYVEPLSPEDAPPGDGDGGAAANVGDAGAPASDCTIVPQYLPNQAVAPCFAINPIPPQLLHVVIPWPESATGALSLDGWTVEVVHPLSGHVLSNPVTLRSMNKGGGYMVDVRYAPVGDAAGKDSMGKELVRLTPPKGVIGPVIEAELSGLQATDPTKAVFPEFGPFPAVVPIESWVWDENQQIVPGAVELTATRDGDRPALDGIKAGIFASYSITVQVGDKNEKNPGKLVTSVPPGHYRARVTPRAGFGLSAAEAMLDVACDHASTNVAQCAPADPAHPPGTRAAQVLGVPRAGAIGGKVVKAIDGEPLDQGIVYALPAAFHSRECEVGVDASTCTRTPLGVLDRSLGEDAFVPRPVNGTMQNSGSFLLKDVDCGSCGSAPADGAFPSLARGASFDLSVQPPDGSRLPWLVRSSVVVTTDVDLGHLTLPLPIVHRGVVQIPQKDKGPLVVPSALIKAYVLRDDTGAIIKSPGGLASCASLSAGSAPKTTRCIRSVLQVAATHADQNGKFELVLPSELQ